jgi:hypothetical protein
MLIKNAFIYKNKNLLNYKYNICYLFKKKKIKKVFLFLKGNKLFKIFKIFFLYNMYAEEFFLDFFIAKYNIFKNI